MSRKKKSNALVTRPKGALVNREQTERALRLTESPEDAELAMGFRRGTSGAPWSAREAAEALAGAETAEELLAITKELVPPLPPQAMGMTSIGSRPRRTPWQQALEEHPPDNAESEK
jgi:hypothetical protein